MDDRTFGARFLDEWRRLTQSSAGFDYQEVEKMRGMDRAEFMAAFGTALIVAGNHPLDVDSRTVEPEELAQAVMARAADGIDIVSILGGFL